MYHRIIVPLTTLSADTVIERQHYGYVHNWTVAEAREHLLNVDILVNDDSSIAFGSFAGYICAKILSVEFLEVLIYEHLASSR